MDGTNFGLNLLCFGGDINRTPNYESLSDLLILRLCYINKMGLQVFLFIANKYQLGLCGGGNILKRRNWCFSKNLTAFD